jgi:hypothetical protein
MTTEEKIQRLAALNDQLELLEREIPGLCDEVTQAYLDIRPGDVIQTSTNQRNSLLGKVQSVTRYWLVDRVESCLPMKYSKRSGKVHCRSIQPNGHVSIVGSMLEGYQLNNMKLLGHIDEEPNTARFVELEKYQLAEDCNEK